MLGIPRVRGMESSSRWIRGICEIHGGILILWNTQSGSTLRRNYKVGLRTAYGKERGFPLLITARRSQFANLRVCCFSGFGVVWRGGKNKTKHTATTLPAIFLAFQSTLTQENSTMTGIKIQNPTSDHKNRRKKGKVTKKVNQWFKERNHK